jgi:MinD-like ATPase involved in chromosome partitioning or flagellar assembly
MKKMIFASTKGGVGKTMLACYFAVRAANSGFKVCLIDFDTYGPNHTSLLEFKKRPNHYIGTGRDFYDIESFIGDPDEIEIPENQFDLYLSPSNIRWVPEYSSFFSIPLYPGTFTLNRMNSMLSVKKMAYHMEGQLNRLIKYLNDEGFDYVILDLAPGLYLGPAHVFKFFSRDEDSIIMYVSTVTDADLLASIYDLDWIFCPASQFNIKAEFRWIFNKVPESRFIKNHSKKQQLEKILSPLKKHLWCSIKESKNLDAGTGLERLLTTIPQNVDKLFRHSSLSNKINTIPFNGDIGHYMADTTAEAQQKLWKELLMNSKPECDIGSALEKIAQEVLN